MIKIDEAIIVEGRYDKIKLDSLVDALVITTDGFEIFHNSEKMELIRTLAQNKGIIIMTDSDSAGFKIRSYITGSIRDGKVYNAYIPDVIGKESRKTEYSKEGKIGVEGITSKEIIMALKRAGVKLGTCEPNDTAKITKYDLYEDGLFGTDDSKKLRSEFLKQLGLPERLSSNSLVRVLNAGFTHEQYSQALQNAKRILRKR